MHIFVNRAHGGKGERRNGVLGCVNCHKLIDNPIGADQIAMGQDYLRRCKEYLREVEHINISEHELCEQLKFSKERDLPPVPLTPKPPAEHWQPKCGDCRYCVRNKRTNSTLPTYFCKRHYCQAKRTAIACAQFEKREEHVITYDRKRKDNLSH